MYRAYCSCGWRGQWFFYKENVTKTCEAAVVTDWRYFVTYEGVVSTDGDDEQAAITAALEDVDNGKIPNVEVEAIDNAGN